MNIESYSQLIAFYVDIPAVRHQPLLPFVNGVVIEVKPGVQLERGGKTSIFPGFCIHERSYVVVLDNFHLVFALDVIDD